MALDTIVMVSALNCAHFVVNSTSFQPIPAKVIFPQLLAGLGHNEPEWAGEGWCKRFPKPLV